MTTRTTQSFGTDFSQQQANRAGERAFTGNANIRPASGMESLSSDMGQRLPGSVTQPKLPVSAQPTFTIGSGTAPVSPSKKRMHNALKMRQGATVATSGLPHHANPFAQYGVANGTGSSQAGRSSARSSPVAAQPAGFGSPQQSPRRVKVVRPSDGATGMNIDSAMPTAATAAQGRSASSTEPTASGTFHSSNALPDDAQPRKAASTAGGVFFSQCTAPSSWNHSFLQTSTSANRHTAHATNPLRPSAAAPPQAEASSPGMPAASSFDQGSSTSAAAPPPPAAATPTRFRFGSATQTGDATDAKPSPQHPFRGFGLHADAAQAAPETPTASFPGFQPGIHSKNSNASPALYLSHSPLCSVTASAQPDVQLACL